MMAATSSQSTLARMRDGTNPNQSDISRYHTKKGGGHAMCPPPFFVSGKPNMFFVRYMPSTTLGAMSSFWLSSRATRSVGSLLPERYSLILDWLTRSISANFF